MRTIEEVIEELKNIHKLEAELKGKIKPSKIPMLLNEILEISKSIKSFEGDLISRQAVIDIIHKEIERTTSFAEHDTQINIEFAVKELPTAYNDVWIPVSSGKLPDESDFYCVTTENIETGDRIEQTAWFAHKDDYDMDESEWRELYGYEKVIAWKKAAPYQPKGE